MCISKRLLGRIKRTNSNFESNLRIDKYRLSPSLAELTGITQASHARVGIMGNPSDGYAGKTLSSTIENFRAVVEIEASPTVTFVPNPIGDANEFNNVSD